MPSDSAGAMLLKLLVKCTVKDVYLAGMDGFSDDPLSNYYAPDYAVLNYDIPLRVKNEEINVQLNKRAKELNLVFLTPSLYKIQNQKGCKIECSVRSTSIPNEKKRGFKRRMDRLIRKFTPCITG